jgi:bacteriocin biosynthesis cyclodehydratase domain-containing protein
MRPLLRPGTHVLRRGRRDLQVGLDPGTALVLPGTPPVRESLRLLSSCADSDQYADPATLEVLGRHRLLLDEPVLRSSLGADAIAPHAAAAVAREVGDRAAEVLAARRACRLQTRVFGDPAAGEELAARFGDLCRRAGIGAGSVGRDGRDRPGPAGAADCGVALGVGEPHRELLDDWTRAGTPYLLLRLTEGRAVVGPFVVPGTTACLRCVDAHCTDADSAWPLLVRQYASASARERPDGVPEPVDPLLASLALAWAARDLASYVDGGRPSTWSTTVTVGARLTRLETRRWLRHPGCGCSWE